MKLRAMLAAGALAAGTAISPSASGALINGDFSLGFSGWQGQVITCAECLGFDDAFVDLDPPAGGFPANYAIPGSPAGTALLSTDPLHFDPFGPPAVYTVSLSQTFTVDAPGAPGSGLFLDYDLAGFIPDIGDAILATLEDLAGLLAPLDLAEGIGQSADITAWAGADARLTFTLVDLSFEGSPNTLSIGNLAIREAQAIPAPGSAWLLGLGLLGLAARRRL